MVQVPLQEVRQGLDIARALIRRGQGGGKRPTGLSVEKALNIEGFLVVPAELTA